MLLRCYCGALLLIFFTVNNAQGAITQGPMNVTYFPGQPDIRLTCTVSSGVPLWIVNGTITIALNQLDNPDNMILPRHSRNGSDIIIEAPPTNNTRYMCQVSLTVDGPTIESDTAFVYVAAAPDQVPDVAVDNNSVSIDGNDGNNVTLTLTWGEPFNNFDPIVNYTVSCSGNVTCPENFTTTDNTTRSYTITNLTAMTNYTFSVEATNSIDSGEAGVVMITAPSLPGNVTGVMLMCVVDDLERTNQCTVDWDPITVGNGLLEQPLEYEVYYNGTRENVTSPTTMLIFPAPSLPDGVFVDNITVIVTAINRFGRGNSSDPPEYFEIMSSAVTNATVTMITPEDATNETYSITVNCTIHPDSDADVDTCEVMAIDNGLTREGAARVTNRMATVTIDGLICGVNYTIIAGGTLGGGRLDGDLVGLRSSHGITMGPCSPRVTPVPTTSMTAIPTSSVTTPPPTVVPPAEVSGDDDNTGAIVGGIVGGIVAAIIIIIIIIIIVYCCMRKEKSSRPTSPGDKVTFRPVSGVKVQTLDRYGKPVPMEGDNTDTGVELTGYTSKSPELTVTQIPSSTVTSTGQSTTFQGNDYQTDEKTRTPSAFMPEGSYDTLAPADEQPVPSAQVIPPAQNGQSNPNAPKLNYAELEQFTRKPASVKKPDPQPASQYAVIDPKSLQQGTYT